MLGSIFAISLGLSVWGSGLFADASFYLLPARAWELFLGALAAFHLRRSPGAAGALASNLLAGLGLALIAWAVFTFDRLTVFPGAAALLPTLGTLLLILYATPQTLVGRLLCLRPVVGIGLISYSAYLWHQPVFAFARLRLMDEPTPAVFGLLILLALGLAVLSWHWVERPFRNRSWLSRRQIFIDAAVCAALLLVVGGLLDLRAGVPARLPEFQQARIALSSPSNPRTGECHGTPGRYIAPSDACVYGDADNVRIALWGDSHANAAAYALGNELMTIDTGLREYSYSACPPVPGLSRRGRIDDCEQFNAAVLDALARSDELQTVILVARWPLYLDGTLFDNGAGGVERGNRVVAYPTGTAPGMWDERRRRDAVAQAYAAIVEDLLALGKTVVLVYPIPEAGWHVPDHLARATIFRVALTEILSNDSDVIRARQAATAAAFAGLPERAELIRIDPAQLFCDGAVPGGCVLEDDLGPLYSDDNHLNNRGATILAAEILTHL